VFLIKSSRKKIGTTFLNFFLNEMIRNIKIHNILDIIDILKSMEPNKCTQKSRKGGESLMGKGEGVI
jgi:hypothetical protein